jgi:hypothetical protein
MMNLVFTSGIIPRSGSSSSCSRRGRACSATFTRQENALVQTCVVACASMTHSGSYYHAMPFP